MKRKNMAQIFKFVYAMIVFLALFLVATKICDGKPFFILFKFYLLLRSFYAIYYHVLVILFYFFY